jgi:hypothetical protein
MIVLVALVVALVRTEWFSDRRVSSPVPPVSSPVPDGDLADVFHFKWLGGRNARYLDQERARREGAPVVMTFQDGEKQRGYPFSIIIDPEKDDICKFEARACIFEFELQTRPGIPWVRIDGIDVIVHDYEPLPAYIAPGEDLFGGVQLMHVYYLEVDNPSLAKTSRFSASYLYGDGKKPKRQELAFVRLAERKPEAFFVRVNAKTPGRYTFHPVVRLSYRGVEREQTVVKTATYLFDINKRKSGQP